MRYRHFLFWAFLSASHAASWGQSPSDFTYRKLQVDFVDFDGRAITNAAIYGFAPELNLLWPRRDAEYRLRDDILWHESYLGKTDSRGQLTATVPPARWEFFAVGTNANGTVVAGWNAIRVDTGAGKLRLAAAAKRRWTFCMAKNMPLNPTTLYFRPTGFPIWISIDVPSTPAIEVSKGKFQVWASAPPDKTDWATVSDFASVPSSKATAGFVLDWGTLNDQSPDGDIFALANPALLDLPIRTGQGSVRWSLPKSFGLVGEFSISRSSQLWISAGNYILGYDRPIFAGINGHFLGQYYNLRPAQRATLDLASPLKASVHQGRGEPDATGTANLISQLFVTDPNGHLLAHLMDRDGNLVRISAFVTGAGQRIAATPAAPGTSKHSDDGDLDLKQLNYCMFAATVDRRFPVPSAVWEFSTRAGVLAKPSPVDNWKMVASSATFQMKVPRALNQTANNLLRQMDAFAGEMEFVSMRKRRTPVTTIRFEADKRRGASASHDGAHITCGPRWLYTDNAVAKHALAHELGHNFGFTHGGLHETVVEVTRCYGVAQISAQPEKWIFFDRMNGTPRAANHPRYPNIGLYLFCYAQRGMRFLNFMTRTEQTALRKLTKEEFTIDEVTIALLNLGMGKDITAIALKNGLNATPDRVAVATSEIKALSRDTRFPSTASDSDSKTE